MSTVTFKAFERRSEVAAKLEAPVRALLADPADAEAIADRDVILAELDRLDRVEYAQTAENIRRGGLRRDVEESVIAPAAAGDTCGATAYSGSTWNRTHGKCGHKARLLVLGLPRCGTHAKREIENAVRVEMDRRERQRQEAGETTEAEQVLAGDRELRNTRRTL